MDPIETLVAALTDEPDDKAAVNALTDELMERYGYTPHGARSRAGRLVNASRSARDVERVVAMLDPASGRAPAVRRLIANALGMLQLKYTPIEVTPGRCFPMVMGEDSRCEFPDGTPCGNPHAAFGAGIQVVYTPDTRRVVVGAKWVLKYEG